MFCSLLIICPLIRCRWTKISGSFNGFCCWKTNNDEWRIWPTEVETKGLLFEHEFLKQFNLPPVTVLLYHFNMTVSHSFDTVMERKILLFANIEFTILEVFAISWIHYLKLHLLTIGWGRNHYNYALTVIPSHCMIRLSYLFTIIE